MLRNDQWERLEQLLPGKVGDPGCTARDNRGPSTNPAADVMW
jgi:hypothetical protein